MENFSDEIRILNKEYEFTSRIVIDHAVKAKATFQMTAICARISKN